MPTPNGGVPGQIDGQQIQQIYSWLATKMECSYLMFRRSVVAYAAGTKADQVVYDAKTIHYSVNGVGYDFYLPRMAYIGYTAKEFDWIDNIYGALVRRIQECITAAQA